jgi:hypothetical protein
VSQTRHSQRGFRSFSEAAEPAPKVWTPVVNAKPRYESHEEMRRWEQAAEDNPRQAGESLEAWSVRVGAAARPVGDSELPPGDRAEPGSDG